MFIKYSSSVLLCFQLISNLGVNHLLCTESKIVLKSLINTSQKKSVYGEEYYVSAVHF